MLVEMSDVIESVKGNLPQLVGAVLGLALHVVDHDGDHRLMGQLAERPEGDLLVNGGGGALELLDKVGNVFLDDLLVGGSAHFAENILRVVGLGRSKTGVADNVGKNQMRRSLKPKSGHNSLRLDGLEDLVDELLGGGLHVVGQGDDGQVHLRLGQLLSLDALQEEHDSGGGSGASAKVKEEVPDNLLLLGGTAEREDGLKHVLDVLGLKDGDDSLEGLELGWDLLLGKVLGGLKLFGDDQQFLNHLGFELLSVEALIDGGDEGHSAGILGQGLEDLPLALSGGFSAR